MSTEDMGQPISGPGGVLTPPRQRQEVHPLQLPGAPQMLYAASLASDAALLTPCVGFWTFAEPSSERPVDGRWGGVRNTDGF